MTRLSSFAPWISGIALAAATLVFTMIGIRYIVNPVGAAAATGAVLSTPLASTTTRIGFGAFPLGIAVFALTSLLSRRVVPAVRLVAIVVSSAIVVRAISIVADGAVPASSRLFVPEIVILLLALAGLVLQRKSEEGAGT